MKKTRITAILLCACLLAGCGATETTETNQTKEKESESITAIATSWNEDKVDDPCGLVLSSTEIDSKDNQTLYFSALEGYRRNPAGLLYDTGDTRGYMQIDYTSETETISYRKSDIRTSESIEEAGKEFLAAVGDDIKQEYTGKLGGKEYFIAYNTAVENDNTFFATSIPNVRILQDVGGDEYVLMVYTTTDKLGDIKNVEKYLKQYLLNPSGKP